MPYFLVGAGGSKSATAAKWHYNKSVSPYDAKYQRTGPDGGWIDHVEYSYDVIAASWLELASARKILPNFVDISRSDGIAVSDRVRRALAALEPDVHDFRPLPIRQRDGTPWPEPYWFCNHGRIPKVEAIDLERSSRWVRWDERVIRGRRFLNGVIATDRDPPEVFLDRNAIAGHHLFGEARAPSALAWFFLSDEAHAALKAANALAGASLGYVGLSGA